MREARKAGDLFGGVGGGGGRSLDEGEGCDEEEEGEEADDVGGRWHHFVEGRVRKEQRYFGREVRADLNGIQLVLFWWTLDHRIVESIAQDGYGVVSFIFRNDRSWSIPHSHREKPLKHSPSPSVTRKGRRVKSRGTSKLIARRHDTAVSQL